MKGFTVDSAIGFTLIELVVTVSIIAILTGGGLAVFTGFRSSRIALNDAQIVAGTLNEARRLAISVEKPSECAAVTLQGFVVSFGVNDVTLQASCPGVTPPESVRTLPTGSIVGTPSPVTFKVLSGGATEEIIDICAEGHLFRVTVTAGGSVSEPQEVVGGC